MAKGNVTMSQKEMNRLDLMLATVSKRLRPVNAARQLGLSARRIKRLVHGDREQGAAGLVSRHRGKRLGHAIDQPPLYFELTWR